MDVSTGNILYQIAMHDMSIFNLYDDSKPLVYITDDQCNLQFITFII